MTVIAQDDHLTAGAWAACEWTSFNRGYKFFFSLRIYNSCEKRGLHFQALKTTTQEEPNKSLFQFLSQCINYLARTNKKLIYAWVGAIPVCGEIHEWLQSLVVRLNWLNEFCQRSLSADDFFIAGISLNDLAKQARRCLLFVMQVVISCLTHRCFHIDIPLFHAVTIFIIQS